MPSLRIVALSVIILGSRHVGGAVDDDDGDDSADVCVDDATYFAQTLWPGRFRTNASAVTTRKASHERPSLCCSQRHSLGTWRPIKRSSPICRARARRHLLHPAQAHGVVPHGGGPVLSEGSAEYNMLAQFAERLRAGRLRYRTDGHDRPARRRDDDELPAHPAKGDAGARRTPADR